MRVPGIEKCIDSGTAPTQDPTDTLTTLFREGSGLCLLLNAVKPEPPIHRQENDTTADASWLQQFLTACQSHNDLQVSDLVTIADFEHELPTQIINTLTYVFEIIEKQQKQQQQRPSLSKHNNHAMRDRVVSELLETERRYVQDLEALKNYMQEAQAQQVLPPYTLYAIFGNLSDLVDFQHRVLALIEEIANRPPYEQHFGKLFIELEIGFAVYEPFCANVQTAQDIIVQETLRLQKLALIMNPTFELPSNMIKPVQRLCKYPLLVQELIKATPESWVTSTKELKEGLRAIQRVTTRVNETKRRQENAKILRNLRRRVKENRWKHSIATFGHLRLHETLTISQNNHHHHNVHIYLFEKALLICEYIPSSISVKKKKKKNSAGTSMSRMMGDSGALAVRGHIFISQVAQLDSDISQTGKYKLMIFWSEKEHKTSLSFVITSCTIIFRSKEQLGQWESTIQKLVQIEKMLLHDFKASPPPPPQQQQQQQQQQKVLVPRQAAPPVCELIHASSQHHDVEEWDRSRDEDDTDAMGRQRQRLGQLDEKRLCVSSATGRRSIQIRTSSNNYNIPDMLLPPLPRDDTTLSDYFCPSPLPPLSYPSTSLSCSYPSTSSTISTVSSTYRWSYKPCDISILPTERSDSISISPDDAGLLLLETAHFSQTRSQSRPDMHCHLRSLSDKDDVGKDSVALHRLNTCSHYYASSPPSSEEIKVRLHFEHELYLVMMPLDMTFKDLGFCVHKKLRQLSTLPKPERITLKYLDEEGDMITIETDDDIQMGLEGRRELNAFNIYIVPSLK